MNTQPVGQERSGGQLVRIQCALRQSRLSLAPARRAYCCLSRDSMYAPLPKSIPCAIRRACWGQGCRGNFSFPKPRTMPSQVTEVSGG